MGADFKEHETNGHEQPAHGGQSDADDGAVVDERDLIDDSAWRKMLRRAFGTAGKLDKN